MAVSCKSPRIHSDWASLSHMLFSEPITVVGKMIGQTWVMCPSLGPEVSPALPKPHDLGKVEGWFSQEDVEWYFSKNRYGLGLACLQ